MFHLVLYQPQIPQNTGAVIRLCAHTGSQLHLIAPLGFTLTEKKLRRAGLGYYHQQPYQLHQDFQDFMDTQQPQRLYFFSSKAQHCYTDIVYQPGDTLVFGSETQGLTGLTLEDYPGQSVQIPMQAGGRCLNLAMSVGIATYEAWRQQQFLNAVF